MPARRMYLRRSEELNQGANIRREASRSYVSLTPTLSPDPGRRNTADFQRKKGEDSPTECPDMSSGAVRFSTLQRRDVRTCDSTKRKLLQQWFKSRCCRSREDSERNVSLPNQYSRLALNSRSRRFWLRRTRRSRSTSRSRGSTIVRRRWRRRRCYTRPAW